MPEVTFSFGENWQKFLDDVHPGALRVMTGYVTDWLGADLKGLDTIDIGSGQGLTSLVIHRAGADVTSLDVDAHSVAATRRVFEGAGKPASWRVIHGSILDPALVRDLGSFDLVISWGVLHHTGSVWRAIDHAASLVRPGRPPVDRPVPPHPAERHEPSDETALQPDAASAATGVPRPVRGTPARQARGAAAAGRDRPLARGTRDALVARHRGLAGRAALRAGRAG